MPVIGVGIDVVDIDRFVQSLERTPVAARRGCSPTPRRRGRRPRWPRGSPPRRRSPRRSARPVGMAWHDAEIVSEETGRPRFEIRGTVAARAEAMGVPTSTSRCPTTPASPRPSWCWRAEPVLRAHLVEDVRRAEAGRDGAAARRRADAACRRRPGRSGPRPARRWLRPARAAAGRPRRQRRRRAVGRRPAGRRGARRSRRCSSPTACTTRGSPPCEPPAAGRPGTSTTLHPTPDVLLDGIVGIGGRPGLRPDAVAALERFAAAPVVAVDVPSGVDVDGGALDGPHVRADLTVTFGTHKVAHLVDPASLAAGAVHLVDLGLDDSDLGPPAVEALQPDDVRALLPRPDDVAHKYTRGVVGVRAGSGTYPGAALLAVSGANSRAGRDGALRRAGGDRRHRAHGPPRGRRRRPRPGLGRRPRRRRRRGHDARRRPRRRRTGGRRRRRPAPRGRDAARLRADPARRRAGGDARRRARGGRGLAAGARTRRGDAASTAWSCSRGTTRSSPAPTGGSG